MRTLADRIALELRESAKLLNPTHAKMLKPNEQSDVSIGGDDGCWGLSEDRASRAVIAISFMREFNGGKQYDGNC